MKKATDRKVSGYRKTFRKFGAGDPRALQWKNKDSQSLRFKELLKDMDLNGKKILDFGCGFGDILSDLSVYSTNYEYIGVDVVPEFIKVAEDTYKNRRYLSKSVKINFLSMDLLKKRLRNKFDVVISSGTLNANINDPIVYRKKVIKILWNYAEETLAFNMAGGFPQPENKKGNRVFYANSLEILEYSMSLTSKVIFRQNYRKKDFTILMFR